MLPRVLEPEAMDTPEEARDYDAMDHAAVNARFVADFLAAHGPCRGGEILDVGTGPARIAIELCRADPTARVLGGRPGRGDARAGPTERRRRRAWPTGSDCVPGDAKALPWPDGRFEAVISNTIVHHIPDPAPALAEMVRLVAPGGTLFVRDLARPATDERGRRPGRHLRRQRTRPPARALFEASLHAALTCPRSGPSPCAGPAPRGVAMTSDRHWTWTWKR